MPIPSRSEPAGPGRWDLDSAAQKLVSRGLLTRTGHQIRVADPGFQDWVQTRLGVAAAQTGIAQPIRPQQLTTTGGRAGEHRPALGAKQDVQQNR
jgi:hypothetical protein